MKPRKTARSYRKEKKGRKGTENASEQEICKLQAIPDFSKSFLTSSSSRVSVEKSLPCVTPVRIAGATSPRKAASESKGSSSWKGSSSC